MAQKTTNKRSLTKISLLFWLICIFLFAVATLVGAKENGLYQPWQNLIFALTLPTGIIAFLVALFSFLFSAEKDVQKKLWITSVIIGVPIILVVSFWIRGNLKKDQPVVSNPSSKVTCTRKEPYKLAPEFERARSLRNQRLQEAGIVLDYSFYNCINIEYADLGAEGAEGMFQFDDKSSMDNLKILVDNSYKVKDDLLTAILLQHEFVHINQFIAGIKEGKETSCIDREVGAFASQASFVRVLNEEEKMSLVQRLLYYRQGGYNNSASLGIFSQISQLIGINSQSISTCSRRFKTGTMELSNCAVSTQRGLIDSWVRKSPAYQKECGL